MTVDLVAKLPLDEVITFARLASFEHLERVWNVSEDGYALLRETLKHRVKGTGSPASQLLIISMLLESHDSSKGTRVLDPVFAATVSLLSTVRDFDELTIGRARALLFEPPLLRKDGAVYLLQTLGAF